MVRTGFALFAALASTPALAAASLDATVTTYTPDRSGVVPEELRPARPMLERRGYSGATVSGRQTVHLDVGVEHTVTVGTARIELELLSIDAGKAKVEVVCPKGVPTVTTVNVASPRFYVLLDGA